ncbi:hypothetical protein BKA56DRAFT_735547 [Ilyonectria sp. MPI-CAGE-AT-0026]|nr:hypothetical protein BKA56DRAFT_735547 [Ilyonectria sp. MPI-CAGE-AT-0026]
MAFSPEVLSLASLVGLQTAHRRPLRSKLTMGRSHNKGRANLALSYASHGRGMIIAFFTGSIDWRTKTPGLIDDLGPDPEILRRSQLIDDTDEDDQVQAQHRLSPEP